MNVVIIGASNKHDRYSYMALTRLKKAGHNVYPVHKILKEIDGIKVYNQLSDIKDPINTVTVYVNSDVSNQMTDGLLTLKPKRIIFNPGAENNKLADLAKDMNIEVVFGCTLVMLSIGSF